MKNYQDTRLTKPNIIAIAIGDAVTLRKPKTRYLVGSFTRMMAINRLLGIVFWTGL